MESEVLVRRSNHHMAYVSIISPVLNQAEYIDKMVQSVMTQDTDDFEHIVMDARSTDGTLERLRAYSHLECISEPDSGQADALNKGIQRAKGEIIGILNGDDYYAPNVFGRISSYFRAHSDCHVLYGDLRIVDSQGTAIGSITGDTVNANTLRVNPHIVRHPSTFVRKSLYDEIGAFDTRLRLVFDYDFLLRASMRHAFHYMPVILSCFRMHERCKSLRFQRRQVLEILQVSARNRTLNSSLLVFSVKAYLKSFRTVTKLAGFARGRTMDRRGWS